MHRREVNGLCSGGGCASKLEYTALSKLLGSINIRKSSQLLLGLSDFEDATVLSLAGERALILTTDFMPPVVRDPFSFGQIAAAHALSDIYAKGGTPVVALALAGVPGSGDYIGSFHEIVSGAEQKLDEAGVTLGGGHSIRTDTVLFGLTAVGFIDPLTIWRKGGARPGDKLILTKPLGTGAIFTGMQNFVVNEGGVEECLYFARELNRTACNTMARFQVHAATDVTGYGIALHAVEVAKASNVTIALKLSELPVLRGFNEAVRAGCTTTLSESNKTKALSEHILDGQETDEKFSVLFDPQTNGGLLLAVPESEAALALDALRSAGLSRASLIGEVRDKEDRMVVVH